MPVVTTTQFDHEHPQYAERADLEALEGRIINRIADLELRLVRDMSALRGWTIGIVIALLLPLYAMNVTILVFLYNAKP
jgi:hypothetical protein